MELEIGAILDGKVTGITKFGAFVALPGGRSGLVHISEVAYSFVNDVNEFLTVGQEVKVKVIGMEGNNRINLSIKQTLPPPPRQQRPANRGGSRGAEGHGGEGRGNGGDYHRNRSGQSGERSGGNNRDRTPRKTGPKEPQTFDDMVKQYMSESETKLSQLNRGERGGGRRRRSRG
ncbi:MAG: S1 RNA-binding domain-containing protein [Clostridiales bacterium]|nr:S1 RNA-binding domain-containing protein [Clostridiales bacterium]